MPLSGSTYVAPTWRNGGPPALDAAELQAISDSIVRNQGKNTDQDTLIAALQTAVSSLQSGRAKIEVGSYVGTGTYGASNPNSITFPFPPKMVIIYQIWGLSATNAGYNSSTIWLRNQTRMNISWNNNFNVNTMCSLSGNTLSWYETTSSSVENMHQQAQLNVLNSQYWWLAIG